jgi:hypothetical protein
VRAGVFTLALLTASVDAGAWCQTTTVPDQPDPLMCPAEGRPIAWVSGCTGFRFDPATLPDPAVISREALTLVLDRSARAWASVACDRDTRAAPSFVLARLPDGPSTVGYDPAGGNTNTVLFRTTWGFDAFHPADAAAVTIVTFGARSASILDADTELNLRGPTNPRGFLFSVTGDARSADLQTIVTHEFGHAMGLAHSGLRDAVMWYTAGRGEQRQVPSADDALGICTMYPPGRFAVCDPDVRTARFGGGGLRCHASPGRAEAPAALLLVLAAVLTARRRG